MTELEALARAEFDAVVAAESAEMKRVLHEALREAGLIA